jgi:hypothetical protein
MIHRRDKKVVGVFVRFFVRRFELQHSSGGSISSDGGATVTARGIAWVQTIIPQLTYPLKQ